MDIENLLEESMKIGNVDKQKVIKILTEGIRDKCNEKAIYKKLYKEIYKNILDSIAYNYWISLMKNENEFGSKWSIEDVSNVAKRLDIDLSNKYYTLDEFRAVMTMEYYEHSVPLKKSGVNLEATGWERMADY